MLTIFIIPCDDKEASDFDRTEKSASKITDKVIRLSDHNIAEIEKCNGWFGYIYSDEIFDSNLCKALPHYLTNNSKYDYLVIYKKMVRKDDYKLFQSPRFFKSDVVIGKGTLIPKEPKLYSSIKVLDGWILENNNVGI